MFECLFCNFFASIFLYIPFFVLYPYLRLHLNNMTSVEAGNFTDDNSKFAKEFEEYRRTCRERYQNQAPQAIQDAEEQKVVGLTSLKEEEEVEAENREKTSSPVLVEPRPLSASNAECNSTSLSSSSDGVKLNTSVGELKKSATSERRNSLTKMFSGMFKKSNGGNSPVLGAKEKEKAKMERKKAEQDFRMARFIAELEMEGRSDEEIQMHLFHIRDQSQFRRPRSNSITEWFKDMHQAFKDEFTTRNAVTLHVSTGNPFAAAAPANYMHDTGYTYEDLVSLEPVPRGLKSFDHLPTTVYEGQELPSNQTTCAVCMAEFETAEELRSLHCTHHFHKECIDKWLGVATTCPVCKGEVESE